MTLRVNLTGLLSNRSGKSQWALNALIGVLAACSIVITGLVVKRELAPRADNESLTPSTVANWRDYATAGHRIGPSAAGVTIVEFSDFQCPSCKELHRTLSLLQATKHFEFRVLYRHYPLTQLHPFAFDAAVASECAAAQGRFEVFYNVLFDKQDSIGVLSWEGFARRADIPDLSKFRGCLHGRAAFEAVQRDITAGNRLGVRGTPTILLEDMQVTGAAPQSLLESWIRLKQGEGKSSRDTE